MMDMHSAASFYSRVHEVKQSKNRQGLIGSLLNESPSLALS